MNFRLLGAGAHTPSAIMRTMFMLCIALVDGARHEADDSQSRREWRQWRGPLLTGEAPESDPPIEWSESKNIKWKTKLGGLGHSTPIVARDSVFLTWASEVDEPFEPRPDTAPGAHDNKRVSSRFEFVAASIDRATGRYNWKQVLHSAIPHEGGHYSASLASASACSDGEHVWFQFGSYGLYCLDWEGKTVWSRSFGAMQSKHGHGEGASPVLAGDVIAVNWDHEGQSFTIVLEKATGKTVWEKNRDEETTWASPIVVGFGGRQQLLVSGTNRIRAYDLSNGELIWQCGGMSHNIVATPVAADGMAFFGSSYETRQMLGIRLEGARGDISSSENVAWSLTAKTPYVPSPLLYDGHLYFLRHYQGILTRLVARTGEEPSGPFRLPGMEEIYASPVAAAGRIYVTDRSGNTVVLKSDEKADSMAVNRLGDRFSASAAIAGNELFLRGEEYLYCISNDHEKNGD